MPHVNILHQSHRSFFSHRSRRLRTTPHPPIAAGSHENLTNPARSTRTVAAFSRSIKNPAQPHQVLCRILPITAKSGKLSEHRRINAFTIFHFYPSTLPDSSKNPGIRQESLSTLPNSSQKLKIRQTVVFTLPNSVQKLKIRHGQQLSTSGSGTADSRQRSTQRAATNSPVSRVNSTHKLIYSY